MELNPYAPPEPEAATETPSLWRRITQAFRRLQAAPTRPQKFLAGGHLMHCGVVFWANPRETSSFFAILPWNGTDRQFRMNVQEAKRNLAELLQIYPELSEPLSTKTLVISMVDSYEYLKHERARTTLPPEVWNREVHAAHAVREAMRASNSAADSAPTTRDSDQ